MNINLMDIVGRVSHQCDIMFRVIDIGEKHGKKIAILYGEDFRLIADAPYEDLIKIDPSMRMRLTKEFRSLEEQSYSYSGRM
ncbi:YabG protein [Mesobacillus boroniphilus JCM 21738]|uniref:YabG protein n=1 Tax=Mesobacillus boroniphilus JCM 21738 TaxID=1294265 RepID=W4RTE6_9BACI|nr:YabG protein [Mesobacillus boroniphilus JCM 21738]